METNKSMRRLSTTNVQLQRGSYRFQNERRKRKRRKPWNEKICDWSRALIAFLFSNVGIVCLVVGYTIVGAFLFTYIEAKDSLDISGDVVKQRNITAAKLWDLTSKENIFSERLWKKEVKNILERYQQKMVKNIRNGYEVVNEEHKKWTFAGAFLYSLTVITTIGYGNICPRTKWGKLCTIIYAIIGMPLFLLYLSNIGDIFARSFKWIYARCCLCKCHKKHREPITVEVLQTRPEMNVQRNQCQKGEIENSSVDQDINEMEINYNNEFDIMNKMNDDDDDDDTSNSSKYDPQQVTVPLTLCLGIMVGYVIAGALLFSKWEDWNMLDGSYFCFVSLSTIGFGDIVPGDRIYSGQGLELSFIFCFMYLMLGMALIAMCFNLMQEEVIAKVHNLARMIKYIFRCDR
ncbi:PREDICTED: potassium channel subfamily K member 9-like isoform X1 [Polistes dominula]|uniref:Potassium channel subfamily K member 9-like isoform X1 n=1 Tax=Polistes dominula TaxID=743375 RepID=A0ABM1IYV5_POLDO|nr:PREDICTED: potassium channel subfamily K member 9-like isoform X1 [Polistes dominula]XP_015185393.1 PREDICTED: potassium channel subfamily K member 9-like isoform X1 [Polistes dominula]XP_015185394.1 PREDICTED: potassium channel subfamily K member 9-like isoform X1 [Polistes dominula]